MLGNSIQDRGFLNLINFKYLKMLHSFRLSAFLKLLKGDEYNS